MKKTTLFLSLFLIFSITSYAQQVKERRVYYLDCSQTMAGKGRGATDIWDEVVANLKNAIKSVADSETTELVLVQFATNKFGDLGPECRQLATANGKNKLLQFIDSIPKPGDKGTMTYHDVPIKDFIRRQYESGVKTYMFLMTDGLDERGDEQNHPFDNIVKMWQYGDEKVYSFYINLNKHFIDINRDQIISEAKHFWSIQTANVNVNVIEPIEATELDCRKENLSVDISFAGNISGIPFDIQGSNRLSVKDYSVAESSTLRLSIVKPTDEIYYNLPSDFEESFHIKLKGADNEGVLKTNSTYNILVEPDQVVKCKCEKGTNISLVSHQISNWSASQNIIPINFAALRNKLNHKSLGTVKYYNDSTIKAKDVFCFSIDDSSIKWKPRAKMHFVFDPLLKVGEIKIFCHGKELDSLNIDKPQKIELVFWLSQEVPEGDYKVQLVLDEHNNLDYFNNEELSEIIGEWTITHKKILPPLVIWFWRILLLLLLSYLLFKAYLAWKAYIAPKFHSNYHIEFLTTDLFDRDKDHNFEMLLDECSGNLVVDRGNAILTHFLHNEYINELVVATPNYKPRRQSKIDIKMHGRIKVLHCNFYDSGVTKIVFKPKRGMKILCEINNIEQGIIQIKENEADTNRINIGGYPVSILARRNKSKSQISES